MDLSEILVCPVCHGSLAGPSCTGCGRTFPAGPVVDLTPDPPPDADVLERWSLWETLQANGEQAYEIDPPSSLSVGDREDVRAFARFADLRGRVLDIGCGPQEHPAYAEAVAGDFVGIDPLSGTQPRAFAFVKAIAEYLPFPDASFDRVLFATSLDHVLSPGRSIAEAFRVTRPGGTVVVWFGEPSPPPALPERLRMAARTLRQGELGTVLRGARATLGRRMGRRPAVVQTDAAGLTFEVPPGAVDAFHVAHPDGATIDGWLRAAGYVVEETVRPFPGQGFMRGRRPG